MAFMKSRIIISVSVVLLLLFVVLFFLGPRPKYGMVDGTIAALEMPLDDLDSYVAQQEAAFTNIRPDNHSRIIWADSIRKTAYAVVYLHGFSASPMEGAPTHQEFAQRYGANLYLPRLAGHGLEDPEAFLDLTPGELIASAKQALAIGRLLGEKVIVMGTSTGCTLATYLAAEAPEYLDALIFYSPNFELADPTSAVLTWPWGLQISRLAMGDTHRSFTMPNGGNAYWTTRYRMEGVVMLKYLLQKTMTKSTFQRVTKPVFLGYYYKNEQEKDEVVSVEAMHEFWKQIQTPENQRVMQAFPEANSHVICSAFTSEQLADVQAATYRFAEDVLGLQPISAAPYKPE